MFSPSLIGAIVAGIQYVMAVGFATRAQISSGGVQALGEGVVDSGTLVLGVQNVQAGGSAAVAQVLSGGLRTWRIPAGSLAPCCP